MQRPALFRAQPRSSVSGMTAAHALGWGFVWPLLVALLLGIAVYQLPARSVVAVGALGDQIIIRSTQAQDAGATTQGLWYPDEQDRGARYRWSRQRAQIALRNVGGGAGQITLQAAGWPNSVDQPVVQVFADDWLLGGFTPGAGYETHTFPLPAQPPLFNAAHRVIALQVSGVLTATVAHPDPRPKGIRLDQLIITNDGGWQMPGWSAVASMLGVVVSGTLAVRRRVRPRVAQLWGVALAVALAVGLAAARLWLAAALPWLAVLAALALLVAERRGVRRWWHGWAWRWRWRGAWNAGLLATLVLVAAGLLAIIIARIPWPSRAAIRENVEWLVVLAAGGGSAMLLLLSGPTLIPFLVQRLRFRLLVGRWAVVGLGLFVGVLVAWQWRMLQTVPLVGHADYADNAVVARNLVQGRGWLVDYATQFYALRPAGIVSQPQPTWPLLQPLLIAPFFRLFGPTAFAARLPNLVFNIALALLLFHIGSTMWDRRVGLIAVILVLLNRFFFRLTLYATSDLAFVVWSLGALWLFWRSIEQTGLSAPRGNTRVHQRGSPQLAVGQRIAARVRTNLLSANGYPLLAGLLMGLAILQKPSGAVLGVGMGVWALGRGLRVRRVPWRTLLVWGVMTVVVISPYLVRNLQTFGTLLASTERYDAWVLGFQGPSKDADRQIYQVFVGDVPDRSWLLRWGWDRTLGKIATQTRAAIKYLLPPTAALIGPVFGAFALAGLTMLRRRQRSLLGLVGWAGAAHLLLLTLYWHQEERYWVAFIPWLLLLAAGGVCAIFDRIASLQRGVWSGLAGLLLTTALVVGLVPHWREMRGRLEPTGGSYWRTEWQPSLDAFAWLQANTARDAVVMSQVPWQLAFYAERQGVMIPNGSLAQILELGRYYHAEYLLVNATTNSGADATAALRPLLTAPDDVQLGETVGNFRLVQRIPALRSGQRPVLIYQFLPAVNDQRPGDLPNTISRFAIPSSSKRP